MLFLLFETANGRYVLEAGAITEVIPLVRINRIPGAPPYAAGIINYRGEPIPVLDLCALIDGPPCQKWMSSRIIIVSYKFRDIPARLLGLLAQRVTDTVRCEALEEGGSGLLLDNRLCEAAEVLTGEMVQRFDFKRIIPEHLVAPLFE